MYVCISTVVFQKRSTDLRQMQSKETLLGISRCKIQNLLCMVKFTLKQTKADNYIAYLLKFLHFSFWRGEANSQVTTFISKARRLSENPTDKLCARRLLKLLRH